MGLKDQLLHGRVAKRNDGAGMDQEVEGEVGDGVEADTGRYCVH